MLLAYIVIFKDYLYKLLTFSKNKKWFFFLLENIYHFINCCFIESSKKFEDNQQNHTVFCFMHMEEYNHYFYKEKNLRILPFM